MSAESHRFDRQLRIFGAQGQGRIGKVRVVLVGYGGLGTFVLPQLCLLGVKFFTVVEHEAFSATNRNRYLGFEYSDYDAERGIGVDKVQVAERVAKSIDPKIDIRLIHERLESKQAFEAIIASDIVIGCLDSDGARAILNEIAVAYGKMYIDLASEVFNNGEFGGRVAVVQDGIGCLQCMGNGLDQLEIRRYFANDQQIENEAVVYGVDADKLTVGTGPAVVDLNGIIASLGVQEIKLALTSSSLQSRFLIYRGHLKTISKVAAAQDPDCYSCGQYELGDAARVQRYLHR